jgi:hypothetical protein
MPRPRVRGADGPPAVGNPLFLVRRLYEPEWDAIFENSAAAWSYLQPERGGWGGPVQAFSARSRAEDDCRARRRALLEQTNPFQVFGGTLDRYSTLPPDQFRDRLAGLGLSPPDSDSSSTWARWWKSNRRGLKAEQLLGLFEAIDRVSPFDVAELPPPASGTARPRDAGTIIAFVVELLIWKDDDDLLPGLSEVAGAWMDSLEPCVSPGGGLRLAAFLDRGLADSYRHALQARIPRSSRGFFRDGFGVAEHPIPLGPRAG